MTPKERAEALASDLNKLLDHPWANGRDYAAAFNSTLRSHAIDPAADPTDDVRQVSKSWWVRMDGRLGKWRPIKSVERPPLIATKDPELQRALEEAEKLGGRVVLVHGDTRIPVIVEDFPSHGVIDPIPDRPPSESE